MFIEAFIEIEGFWPLGANGPWDFLISSFAHFTGLLCDGSILFGVEGYGAYFVFW